MPPQAYDLSVYRGDTFRLQFRLWNDVAKTQPTDLTGVTAAAEVRDSSTTTPVGTFTTGIAANVVTVSATATQTRQLPDLAMWDLQLTWGSGDIQTIVRGVVRAVGDITASSAPATLRREKAHAAH